MPPDYDKHNPEQKQIYRFVRTLFSAAQLTAECAIVTLVSATAETLYQVTLSKLVEAYVFCETREWISSECGVFESPIRKSRMMSHSKPVSAVSAEVFNADDSHRADVLWTKNILNQCLVSFCSLPTIILMTIECSQAYIQDVVKCQ